LQQICEVKPAMEEAGGRKDTLHFPRVEFFQRRAGHGGNAEKAPPRTATEDDPGNYADTKTGSRGARDYSPASGSKQNYRRCEK